MFASNPHQVFRQLNNENSIAPAKSSTTAHGSTSKTPSTSGKQRRALGDISNRKQVNLNGDGGVVLAKKTQGLRPQSQRNPLTTKTPGLTKKGVTFLPRPTQSKPSQTVSIFPDLETSKFTTKRPAQKIALKNTTTNVVLEPVDDIERPAGRLGIEEPDDYSCASVSLPETDWAASRKKQRDLHLKWKKEEEEREDAEYAEYIAKALEDDEPSALIGEDVWIERTLSFDDDLEDELSFDAPSFCGDISF